MYLCKVTLSLLLMSVVLYACSSEKEEARSQVLDASDAVDADVDLMQQWRAVLETDVGHMHLQEAIDIVHRMAEQGPQGIEPVFQVLVDQDESDEAKLLAVISLSPQVDEEHVERLLELTDAAYNNATRGCALHLLSRIPSPEGMERIRELFDDEDSHVSKVAAMILLRYNDPEAVDRAVEMWQDPETRSSDRNEIILAFPAQEAQKHVGMFADAMCMEGIDPPARTHSINIVGILGTPEVMDAVDACLEEEADPEMRVMLEAAKAAIESRLGLNAVEEGETGGS